MAPCKHTSNSQLKRKHLAYRKSDIYSLYNANNVIFFGRLFVFDIYVYLYSTFKLKVCTNHILIAITADQGAYIFILSRNSIC